MPDDLPALSRSSTGWPDVLPWREWGAEAFDLARTSARPILLVLGGAWNGADERLEAALTDVRLAALVRRFVAVRVDAEERPDIATRYGPAPVVIALTPEGEPFDRAEPDADAVVTLATSALARWDGDREDVLSEAETARITRAAGSVAAAYRRGSSALTPAILDITLDLLETAEREYDSAAHSVEAARLWRYAHHRRRTPGAVERARAAASAALHRAARPASTCCANDIGEALLAVAELAREDDDMAESLRETVEEAAAFLDAALGDSAGGLRHTLPPARAPVFADSCARAARGLIEAGSAFNRRDWTARGLRAVEFMAYQMRAGEAGVYHAWDGDARVLGLLADQVETLLALLTAYEVNGGGTYLEHARNLARLLERGWWERGHGFLDTADGHEELGLLDEAVIPFALNVAAAEANLWLARLTHDDRYLDVAMETLAAISPGFESRGAAAASFARVVDRILTAEPEVKVVGEFPVGEPDGVVDPLYRAALRLPVAARTVQRLSLLEDAGLMRDLGLPGDRPRVAYVCAGRDCSAPITNAETLVAEAAALVGFGDPLDDDEDANDLD